MSLPELPDHDVFKAAMDEMISNGYEVSEELCERALTTTAEPFHVHVFAWPVQDGDTFYIKVAGYWHVADELALVNHDFGKEMPGWRSADPASTVCTTDASPEEPDGGVTASTS
jgi:transposase InsO family protein